MMPPMTTSAARSNRPLSRSPARSPPRCRSDDLAHRLPDFRGVKAHRDDRVGAHHGRIFGQTIDCLASRVLEQVGVFMNLAADNRAQPGHHVAAEPAAADDDAKALSLDLDYAVTRNILGSDDQHFSAPSQQTQRMMQPRNCRNPKKRAERARATA